MDRRSLVALGLACLLATAGCSTLAPDGQGPDADSATATPAPVPSDSPTPAPGLGDVPGLTVRGIEDPFDLASAHRAVLANATHTVRIDETTVYPNGTLRSSTRTVSRVDPRPLGDRYHAVTRFAGPVHPIGGVAGNATRVERYADNTIYEAVTFPNGSTVYRSYRPVDFQRRTLELVVTSFDARVVSRSTCGEHACFRVESTALTAPGFLAAALVRTPDRTIVGGSFLALVDVRGLVREYRVRYRVETPTGAYVAVRRVRYEALGETTVTRPEWVGNATGG